MGEKLALSVTEAAKLLGISRNTAYAAIKDGDLPVIRLGRRVLIPVAALEKKLNVSTVGETRDAIP